MDSPSAINARAFPTIGTRSGHRGSDKVLTEAITGRDDWSCRNPECGRRSIRVQAHHIHWRSLGGSDELNNGITLCPVCHLRLVHGGIISVQRQGAALIWRYPGRVVVAL